LKLEESSPWNASPIAAHPACEVSQYLRNRGLAAKQYRMVNRIAPLDSIGENSVAISRLSQSFQTSESFIRLESGAPVISISELFAAMNSDELS
jgi:hypothetical protein